MAAESSAVISAVGKLQSQGRRRMANRTISGPPAPTASSKPKATQKKVTATSPVQSSARRGRNRGGPFVDEAGVGAFNKSTSNQCLVIFTASELENIEPRSLLSTKVSIASW